MKYCVSDIHGELGLFQALLDKIGFTSEDEMYVCGDVIDKGESSVGLLKYISSFPNIHCILGNHELAFLNYYHSLLESSPSDFDGVLGQLKEYFPEDGHLLEWELVDWIDNLPAYVEEENFICVHAGIPIDASGNLMPTEEADVEELVHDRRFKDPYLIHQSPKCVFFGHTETSCISGENKILGYRRKNSTPLGVISDFYKIHLDTGSWSQGVLGCFCIDTLRAVYVRKNKLNTAT